MLKKITIKNFKTFEVAEIDLDRTVVFVGPNNCGKTTALQAISLFFYGVRAWAHERLEKKSKATERTGVSLNRRDLLNIPIPETNQLWKDVRVQKSGGHIYIQIIVEGYTRGESWRLGMSFDHANKESIRCRIMDDDFPPAVMQEWIGFIPPMSGMASAEDKFEMGSILSRIGEGNTSSVVRNLCYKLIDNDPQDPRWKELVDLMNKYFGISLNAPVYYPSNGQITMSYDEEGKRNLDLINLGTGAKQVLLLFSYLYATDNSILLLDEPDAHLEMLRQKQIFNELNTIVKRMERQVIIATHSEAVLDEAWEKSKVISFVGQPHVANDKKNIYKSLTKIGFDQYLKAEQKGWVLYLEGSTDLDMLRAFAQKLNHSLAPILETAFVKYVGNNNTGLAIGHYEALSEACPSLKAIALFDRIVLPTQRKIAFLTWGRREIENYIPLPQTLSRYAERQAIEENGQVRLEAEKYMASMRELLDDYIPRAAQRDKNDSWWSDTKMSDDFLDKILPKYFEKTGQPHSTMSKHDYFRLVDFAESQELDAEVKEKLDAIYAVHQQAGK